jgi:hypothetical protein
MDINNEGFASAPCFQVRCSIGPNVSSRLTDSPQLVELFMPKEDAPAALKLSAEAKWNAKK